MRKLVILLAFALLISCAKETSNDFSTPKKVIIAGKVENIDPNNLEVKFYVNRLGLNQSAIFTKADSSGNFQTSFETYTPTDVWVQYKTNILVLVRPGDSIHVEFDGQPNRRPQILETIKFSGDGIKANQDAAKFQLMYFSNPLYYDWDAKGYAKKTYDVDQYLLYLDTLQQRIDELYSRFLAETAPDHNVKIWAKTYIEQDYYDAISWYPLEHLRSNNLRSGEWEVPETFFDALLTRLPIEKNMLVSGYALSNFINRFHYNYSRSRIWEEEQNKQYKTPEGYIVGPTEIMDSLTVYGIIKYTPDSLLRQMVLTEFFVQNLDNSGIRLYEKYKNIADEYILEPFLREPLFELYAEVKNRIENPVIATDAYLKKLENTTARQLFDSILTVNKGKVIYLDCWATWCGPCKEEMPHSKKLMEELKDEDVSFVFLCIDSEENLWKANLAEFQIGGQHYFLSREQSADLRKVFEVQGIPHYFLINQRGVIVEKGSYLRPNHVKDKLLGLLEG
ncbi:TlpA family protein disulfide reductase [Gaoshiqia sp. Z1-71]|uniref:TlpA family protein disulfide reductase n=1 Tax=Gaoshiqia hydrogeniformans TaxID=3290090 RepID=UPI003BF8B499